MDDRAFSFRHDLSSLAPTLMISETPPKPPRASLIINIAFVPAGMAASQLNWRFPLGTGMDKTLPPGTTTEIVTGCTALPYPSNVKGLHCCKAKLSWNGKSTPGSVVLHDPPRESPTVRTCEVPPAPNAVASDIVKTICWSLAKGSCMVNDPRPLVNADGGIWIIRWVPKGGLIKRE